MIPVLLALLVPGAAGGVPYYYMWCTGPLEEPCKLATDAQGAARAGSRIQTLCNYLVSLRLRLVYKKEVQLLFLRGVTTVEDSLSTGVTSV